MKKIALFICSFDGIATRHSGVGTATFGYFSSIENLKKELSKKGFELECHALTNNYSDTVLGYNTKLLKRVKEICRSTGGDVHYCLNNSSGDVHFGEESNWSCVSASAATIASKIVEKNNFKLAILIGIDTPYAFAPIYFKKQTRTKSKIVGIFTPHSTSLIHERGNFNLARLDWEQKCMSEINKEADLFVSYLNKYMFKHLNLDYGVNEKSLIPLINGVNFDDIKYWTQDEIEKDLIKYGIPVDKPLIFTYGRGAWYKGFDLFLAAAKCLKLPVHYVLQIAPYSSQEKIKEKITLAGKGLKDCTMIFEWSFDLPRKILQWNKTLITAVLSRYEPGAFIPAEIRIYANSICLVSDRDGLPCQVSDSKNGFICNIDSITDIILNIKKIYGLESSKRKLIIENGKKLIEEEYNIQRNFIDGIKELISRYLII